MAFWINYSNLNHVIDVGVSCRRKGDKIEAENTDQCFVVFKLPNIFSDWYNMGHEGCDEARLTGGILNSDEVAESEDSDAEVQNNRNHGARFDGSRMFEMKKGPYCRYFMVERRDGATLVQIIQQEVEVGS
ncbi:hypothetical protein FQA39_LY05211 [Lamprigera yunnana]|nr:hypothetical protein FQA39_LY05211 [Lamprigera yunnana]